MGEIPVGECAERAEATDKESGSGEGGAEKSLGMRLAGEKEDEGGRPPRHGEIGKGGDDGKIGATAEAEFERPRADGVKKRSEQG